MQTALKVSMIVNYREDDNQFVDYCRQWCHLYMLMYLGAAVAFYFLWLSLPPCPPLYRHPLSCSPEGLNALTLRGALYFKGGGIYVFTRCWWLVQWCCIIMVIHCSKCNFLLVSGIKLYKKMSWSWQEVSTAYLGSRG